MAVSKRKSTIVLRIAILLMLFVVVERLCHRATKGFRVQNIVTPPSNASKGEQKEATPSHIRDLLQQPFHFLGSGGQFYAFASEDGLHVLKVFKQHRMHIPSWLKTLPLPQKLQQEWDFYVRQIAHRKEKILSSCIIAATELKEETGTIYSHLNPTSDLQYPITILDNLSIAHELDADQLQFILQKRAILVEERIDQLMQEGKVEEAVASLCAIVELTISRCQKGIADDDPVISRNFGFVDGRAVEIDLGSYSRDPFMARSPAMNRELYFECQQLQGWLENRYPALVPRVLQSFLHNES